MNLLLFFLVGIVFGCSLTWVVRLFALKKGIMNKPNPIIPHHIKPIAYLGGVGIVIGAICALIFSYVFEPNIFHELVSNTSSPLVLLFGSAAYLIWGAYDDIKQLKVLPKFLGQLILAIVCVGLGIITSFFPSFKFIDFIFSIFWILLVVNAVNFTDVCDGLVGGISVINFLVIGFWIPHFSVFGILISGVTAGFLFFNLHKASIFLGDAGSHFLGFLIASVGIFGSAKLNIVDGIIWMSFTAGVPLFELVFLTVVRMQKGKNITHGSPDHFSLRLQKAGFTRLQIVGIACLATILFATIGCLFQTFDLWLKILSATLIITLSALSWKYLLYWDLDKK